MNKKEIKPTSFDINREYFENFSNVFTTQKEREAHKHGFIAGAAWYAENQEKSNPS